MQKISGGIFFVYCGKGKCNQCISTQFSISLCFQGVDMQIFDEAGREVTCIQKWPCTLLFETVSERKILCDGRFRNKV